MERESRAEDARLFHETHLHRGRSALLELQRQESIRRAVERNRDQ
jgi:hypothetical protein